MKLIYQRKGRQNVTKTTLQTTIRILWKGHTKFDEKRTTKVLKKKKKQKTVKLILYGDMTGETSVVSTSEDSKDLNLQVKEGV